MKLFTTAISPNCRRVEAVLHHHGLYDEIEIERLNLGVVGPERDELAKVNPNCKVPTLVMDDIVLWEANPTMIYLADRAWEQTFCPSGPRERFELMRWQSWEVQHFNRAVGDIVWETIAKPALGIGGPDEAKIAAAEGNFHRFAAILDAHLVDRTFVMGEALTVADFSVGSHSALALHPQSQVPLAGYENIRRWYHRLEDVPAWAATAPQWQAEAAE
ncbi:glutathione S-transferase family protein [Labrenzia sp. CE80]|uniref:glutathione S-transferase family protein n=1 Tax=Labrenzia sp. CE80 TaxID=1788986 RepID=UPI00129ADCC0|nr:glutathione S-transferase family protein [Labrenzia sp. CE80]